MEVFLAVLRDLIAKTRATEAGCLQFDLLLPSEGTDVVHVYEVYADERALGVHDSSNQLANYRAESGPLLTERTIISCAVED
jgi:quinol monooxygenase YgiN